MAVHESAPTPIRARRRFGARDAVRTVAVTALVLVACDGAAVGRGGRQMSPGVERDVVVAVGHPTGWIADHLPFAAITHQVTGWLSSDEDLSSHGGGFAASVGAGGPGRVAPAAFAPADLGARPSRPALRRLLVTGDSMSQPLDAELARSLAGGGTRAVRDAHIGSGISKSFVVDWSRLAAEQEAKDRPEAVVMFLGANEGFPMRSGRVQVTCCGAAWAAEYATRARAVMSTYLRGGAQEVYWILIPAPRDPGRARIARTVNTAVRVAAGAFGAQVQVIDDTGLFTPGGRFRSAIAVAGRQQIVRNPDGIHLNELGASLLRDVVDRQLATRFTLSG